MRDQVLVRVVPSLVVGGLELGFVELLVQLDERCGPGPRLEAIELKT